jgi:NAD(P) transhydrogenase subunit alpha
MLGIRLAALLVAAPLVAGLSATAWAQGDAGSGPASRSGAVASASDLDADPETPTTDRTKSRGTLVASITIFVLAIFVGFEVITKVPPTLHTPLMSGSNAISGITLVGALLAAGTGRLDMAAMVGTLAVILATINVVGGFLVTHRMLAMFRKK